MFFVRLRKRRWHMRFSFDTFFAFPGGGGGGGGDTFAFCRQTPTNARYHRLLSFVKTHLIKKKTHAHARNINNVVV